MSVQPDPTGRYETLHFLGKGAFGKVYQVRRKIDGAIFARKEIYYGKMQERHQAMVFSEFENIQKVKHTHIVESVDAHHDVTFKTVYMYMEFCGGGDLKEKITQCLQSETFIPEDVIWSIAAQTASALYKCHNGVNPAPVSNIYRSEAFPNARAQAKTCLSVQHSILHRDLKPDNIFLDENNIIKLGDFGLSKALSQSNQFATTSLGTPYYMSPEQQQNQPYTLKSDIWSLGCVLYELCELKVPFDGKDLDDLCDVITEGKYTPVSKIYSYELRSLIHSCLRINPTQRPNTAEILQLEKIRVARREVEVTLLHNALKKKEASILQAEHGYRRKTDLLNQMEQRLRHMEFEQINQQQKNARDWQAQQEAFEVDLENRRQQLEMEMKEKLEQKKQQLESEMKKKLEQKKQQLVSEMKVKIEHEIEQRLQYEHDLAVKYENRYAAECAKVERRIRARFDEEYLAKQLTGLEASRRTPPSMMSSTSTGTGKSPVSTAPSSPPRLPRSPPRLSLSPPRRPLTCSPQRLQNSPPSAYAVGSPMDCSQSPAVFMDRTVAHYGNANGSPIAQKYSQYHIRSSSVPKHDDEESLFQGNFLRPLPKHSMARPSLGLQRTQTAPMISHSEQLTQHHQISPPRAPREFHRAITSGAQNLSPSRKLTYNLEQAPLPTNLPIRLTTTRARSLRELAGEQRRNERVKPMMDILGRRKSNEEVAVWNPVVDDMPSPYLKRTGRRQFT